MKTRKRTHQETAPPAQPDKRQRQKKAQPTKHTPNAKATTTTPTTPTTTTTTTPTPTPTTTHPPNNPILFPPTLFDIWTTLILPRLDAHSLVALSFTCKTAHHLAHHALSHDGEIEVFDTTRDLSLLPICLAAWPNLRVHFEYIPPAGISRKIAAENLRVVGRVDCLMLKGARVYDFAFLEPARLSSLSLDEVKLRCGACESLGTFLQISALQELDLWDNNIGDESCVRALASGLRGNNHLRTLSICGNNIGERIGAVTTALSRNSVLTELLLSRVHLHDGGAKLISEMLKVNKTLRCLGIRGNGLRDKGAQYIAEALTVNTTLKSLDMADNLYGNEGASHVGWMIRSNSSLTHLDLSSSAIFGPELGGLFAQLAGGWTITDVGMHHLIEALQQNFTLLALSVRPARFTTMNSAMNVIDPLQTTINSLVARNALRSQQQS